MNKWKDFNKIYLQSITNSYRLPIFWTVVGLCAFTSIFFIIGLPLILFFAMHDINGGFGCNQTITMTSTILTPFLASFMAEINSSPNERIFVLSRPVDRDIYLTSKFFASLTITLGVLIMSILSVWVIWTIFHFQNITEHTTGIIALPFPSNIKDSISGDAWNEIMKQLGINFVIPPKYYHFNFADLSFQSVKPENLCINLIVLTFFGTVVGQCYSLYFREAVPSILVLVIALLYTMSFSVFTFTSSDNSLLNPNDTILKLQFLYLPMVIFGGGGILLWGLSYYFNRKIDDGR